MDFATLLVRAQQAYAQGRYPEAITQAQAALRIQTDEATALGLLANSAMHLQDGALAVHALGRLHALQPQHSGIARSLSRALNRRGHQRAESDEAMLAIADWRAALNVWPENPEAAFNLASRGGGLVADDEAIRLLQSILQQHPEDLAALRLLALCLRDADAPDAARALLDAQPDSQLVSPGWRTLTLTIAESSRLSRCIASAPAVAEWTEPAQSALASLATAQREQEARAVVRVLEDAEEVGQHAPTLRIALARHLSIPTVHPGADSIARTRAQFADGLRNLASEFDATRLRRCAPRLAQLNWSNFLLAYQGENDLGLQSRYGDWLQMAAGVLRPDLAAPLGRRRPGPPRIGLLSGHWYRSTVGSYFSSWIDALDRPDWDTQVFAIGPRFDGYTDQLASRCRRFHRLDGDIDEAADLLRAADLDLLIYPELGMDTRLMPLAALRLARQQWLAWGHPISSGLPTMDAFLSCADMEPEGADTHYREKLLRLPGLGTRYDLPAVPHRRTRGELGLPSGPLVMVPQSLFKIHPENDRVFHQLLDRRPDARLLFFCSDARLEMRILRERFEVEMGATLARRILWHPMTSREHFLELLASADLMLDTLHWSGGNSSLDALRAGLPIATTPTHFMRGRQSTAMLRSLDCSRSVAADGDALAALAAEFLSDQAPRPRPADVEAYATADEPLQALVALAHRAFAGVV